MRQRPQLIRALPDQHLRVKPSGRNIAAISRMPNQACFTRADLRARAGARPDVPAALQSRSTPPPIKRIRLRFRRPEQQGGTESRAVASPMVIDGIRMRRRPLIPRLGGIRGRCWRDPDCGRGRCRRLTARPPCRAARKGPGPKIGEEKYLASSSQKKGAAALSGQGRALAPRSRRGCSISSRPPAERKVA